MILPRGGVEIIDMPEDIGKDLYRHLEAWVNGLGLIEDYFCVLEKAQAMSKGGKQGVKSMMTYGIGYGEIRAVLKVLSIPFQEVAAATWKKEFSLWKKDKKESVKVAKQLFPTGEYYGVKGGMKDGRAEAALLAEYARRIRGNDRSSTRNRNKKLSRP